jgi:hypothetical protein
LRDLIGPSVRMISSYSATPFRMAAGRARETRLHLHQPGLCQPFRQDVSRFAMVFDQCNCLDIKRCAALLRRRLICRRRGNGSKHERDKANQDSPSKFYDHGVIHLPTQLSKAIELIALSSNSAMRMRKTRSLLS